MFVHWSFAYPPLLTTGTVQKFPVAAGQDKKHGSAWGVLTWKGVQSAQPPQCFILLQLRHHSVGGRLRTGVQQQEQPIRIQGSLKRVWRLKDGAESGVRLKGAGEAEGGA